MLSPETEVAPVSTNFGIDSRAVRAYLLKEDFQLFCDYVSPPWLASSWTAGAPGRCDPSSTP